jgi:Mor family transcriptional regulator
MHQHNLSTTPSVARTSTPSSGHKLDPIAVLREELAAAAICHGVERVDDLTEALVDRYVQRLGGLTVYVRNDRVKARERLAAQIRANFDGRNAKELARKHHLSLRQVQRILLSST